ncbi:MAG TPA: hypothetical protein VFX45_06715 [Solirubrobacterales bacterium]|nr:hypothetical protein [Solirubrobacterales bacterium]
MKLKTKMTLVLAVLCLLGAVIVLTKGEFLPAGVATVVGVLSLDACRRDQQKAQREL